MKFAGDRDDTLSNYREVYDPAKIQEERTHFEDNESKRSTVFWAGTGLAGVGTAMLVWGIVEFSTRPDLAEKEQ